jgi:FixJ family two-component response regulator
LVDDADARKLVLLVGAIASLNKMTGVSVIHVVDDDASFRTSMSRLLEAQGYRIALYASGNAFLEKLPADETGCILLDLQMAGVQGFELQQQLAKIGNTLPIIFLTAHGDIRAGVQAIKARRGRLLAEAGFPASAVRMR